MRPLFFLLFLLPLAAFADQAPPALISLRLEYYAVEKSDLTTLLAEPSDSTDATRLRKKIRALIPKESAGLIDSAYLTTRSGQRARIEAAAEWPYATSYNGPSGPQELTGPVDSNTGPITPVNPAKHHTANLGLVFEVEPVLRPDGHTLDINLAPGLVTRTGDNTLNRSHAPVTQPVLHTLKTSTAITMRSGTWATVGLHSPPSTYPAAATRQVISLINATVQIPGNPATIAISKQRSAAFQKFRNAGDPFGAAPDKPSTPEPAWLTRRHQIAVIAEWFETDATTATSLLDKHTNKHADATALRNRLLELTTQRKATLVEHSYLTTRSGQRTSAQSVREIPDPIGIHPPSSPKRLTGHIDPSVRTTTRAVLKPTGFRPVGTTVEVDPVIGTDHLSIDINIAPELTTNAATTTIGHGDAAFDHPVFYTFKPTTSTTLHDAIPALLAMGSPAPPDVTTANFTTKKRLLLILTTRLLKIHP